MRASIMLALLALPIAACTPNDVTFGGAVKSDYALQTINPDPHAQSDAIEGGSGAVAGAAAERYRTDKVKQPPVTQTTNVGVGGGGGSGVSGGSGGGS